MSSSGSVVAGIGVLFGFLAPLAGQAAPRLTVAGGEVPPRLSAEVTRALARSWATDSTAIVLSWGMSSLAGYADEAQVKLLGHGEGGWFVATVETPGRPAAALRLRAGVTVERLVAARVLRPGMRLTEGDLKSETHVQWGPPMEDAARPEVGWLVKRPLAIGEPVAGRVEPPPAISAGQPVRVLWADGNVTVALEGTALNDAALGGTIRVRTGRRTGVLTGTVTAPGEARMR